MTQRCTFCGHFIGYNDTNAFTWTRWGSSTEQEPPEPYWCCGECYNDMTDDEKKAIADPNKFWQPAVNAIDFIQYV